MAVMETLSGSGKVGDRTFDYIDFDPWPSEYAESQGSSPSPPTLPTSTDQLQFSMAFPTRMAPSSFAGASQNVSPLQDQTASQHSLGIGICSSYQNNMSRPIQGSYNSDSLQFPANFGSIPAGVPWSFNRCTSTSTGRSNLRPDYTPVYPCSNTTPPPTVGVLQETGFTERRSPFESTHMLNRRDSSKKRAASWDFHRPYLREMAAA
ncbi:hypothetical protein M758_UG205400 [Ceratodon purpureus]|nr:hypothetical protein M758_UG205400 [Ceratodon purpureus]